MQQLNPNCPAHGTCTAVAFLTTCLGSWGGPRGHPGPRKVPTKPTKSRRKQQNDLRRVPHRPISGGPGIAQRPNAKFYSHPTTQAATSRARATDRARMCAHGGLGRAVSRTKMCCFFRPAHAKTAPRDRPIKARPDPMDHPNPQALAPYIQKVDRGVLGPGLDAHDGLVASELIF
jgi:hypothetical protein